MVDVFINWVAPRTASPIQSYTVVYGGKSLFGIVGYVDQNQGTLRTLPPVSSVECISIFSVAAEIYFFRD